MGRLGQLLPNIGHPNNPEKLLLLGLVCMIPSGVSNFFYILGGTIEGKCMCGVKRSVDKEA